MKYAVWLMALALAGCAQRDLPRYEIVNSSAPGLIFMLDNQTGRTWMYTTSGWVTVGREATDYPIKPR